jgi:uncharacterized protein (DUF1778 family)
MAPDTRKHSEVRQRQVMLAIRVNADEEKRIRAAAKRRGMSVAALLRESALSAADQVSGDRSGEENPVG